jgi:integrase
MPRLKLTDPFIRNHPEPEKRMEIYDSLVNGLAVRITPTGTKSFVYRYRFNDTVRRYTIGRFPAIGLADARQKVKELAYQTSQGIDPLAEKKNKKKKPKKKTFVELARMFKEYHLPKLKKSTQKTYTERIDAEILPVLSDQKVCDIKRSQIMEMLEDIAYGRGRSIHSNRVRAILSSMFSFAVQRGIAEFNPVKTIKPLGKETKRDRVLTEDEIKRLWNGFATLLEPSQSVLKILLLLGQRKGETRRMRWDDLDLNKNLWIIPADQTKAKRKHWLPLPPLAITIIERLKNDSEYVFASKINEGESVKWFHNGFNRLADELNIVDVRIHDLRRTAATYMAEMGTDRTILGKVLNHKGLAGDSQVTARYDRYGYMDEKRRALNRWNQKLLQIIEGTETKIHKIG